MARSFPGQPRRRNSDNDAQGPETVNSDKEDPVNDFFIHKMPSAPQKAVSPLERGCNGCGQIPNPAGAMAPGYRAAWLLGSGKGATDPRTRTK